tara:strand:+ start:15900 stop:16502 length:603 start_codon:yes stop_codon:yes gene_type:complete
MALDLKFNYTITSDRSKLIVTDITGLYSVNNLEGWGAPNIERSSVGLYAYVTYQPFGKVLETQTAITEIFDIDINYLNDHKSTFEFVYNKDGWYRILLVAMTQNEYDQITDSEILINSELYPNTYFEDMIMVNIIVQKNCYLEKYINCLQCTNCKCDPIKEDVIKLNLLIQSTDYRFHSAKQFEAQKMIESLTKQYKCCN